MPHHFCKTLNIKRVFSNSLFQGGSLNKTLIAYQTLYGSTKEAAQLIAEILKEDFQLEVDVHRFEKDKIDPSISEYDNLVLGSCIFNGEWGRKAEEFLKNDFSTKKLALFVCSGFAGEQELYKQARRTFLNDIVEKYPKVKPVSMEAFGGRVPVTKVPHVWYLTTTKQMPKFRYDNRNLDKVKKWAFEVGKIFSIG